MANSDGAYSFLDGNGTLQQQSGCTNVTGECLFNQLIQNFGHARCNAGTDFSDFARARFAPS
jgi:hypothetical protein